MSQINIYNEPSAEVIIDENGTPVTVIIATSGAGGAVWGTITGTLSNQTDLQNALNAKVPYSGATGNVNLGEYGISAGYVQLDTTPTTYTPAVGNIGYNDTVGTLETTLKGGTVQLKIGRDMFERVVNKTGVQLTKAAYQAVRISTAQGQRLGVALAQANNDNNSADTIGLAVETIDNNQEGNIYTVGEITGINTTGSLQGETWADGDVLYLSPTVAGRITNVKPIAPQHLVIIGYVVYAHQNNGKIYVKVMNGWELGELHDVDTTGATNGQVLKYNGTIWAPSADAGITGSGNTDYVAKFTGSGTIGNSVIRVSGTDATYFSTYKGANSNGDNIFIGGGGQSSIGDISNTNLGSYNTALGTSSLNANTTGNNNVAVGNVALNVNTTGFNNSAIGSFALNNNTTGYNNVAVGTVALRQNSTGIFNTAVGSQSLSYNTVGSFNTAFGYSVLESNTTASYNSAFGSSALLSNTTGSSNTAIGVDALRGNITGLQNSTLGRNALYGNTNGNNNTALGFQAGYGTGVNPNTTGANNIFIGSQSVGVSSTESNRTWIGNSSTTSTWLGGNLLLGSTTDAGQRLQVTGNVNFGGATGLTWDNTNKRLGVGLAATGYRFEVFGTSYFDDNVLIGNGSQLRFTSSQLYIKPELVSSIWSDLSFTTLGAEKARITGTGNLLLGTTTDVGTSILTMDSTTKGFLRPRMTTVQRDAIVSPATGLSIYNTTTNRVNYYNGTAWTEIQDSITNPVTGTGVSGQVSYWSGTNTQAGSNNLFWDSANNRLGIGTNAPSFALQVQSDAQINGVRVGLGGGSVSTNTIVGSNSGGAITTGSNNTFVGVNSGQNNTASNNTFFGSNAGRDTTTSGGNAFFGYLSGINNTTGSNTCFFGSNSGRFTSSGGNLNILNQSVLIGAETRANASLETNQIAIGYAAVGLGSNTTVIGNSSTTFGRWWGNLLIGSSVNGGQALQITGLSSFTGTTTSDGGQLGAELLSASGWTSTGWTGDYATGFTHTVGNTNVLSNPLTASSSLVYQIQYTITGRTAGTISIAFGGQTLTNISATGTQYIYATTSGTVAITPTSDFDGTIIPSIRAVSKGSATVQLRNSGGTLVNEVRTSNSNTNTYIGVDAGSRSLTAVDSVAIGVFSLQSNVNGTNSVAIGRSALQNSASSFNTIAIGSNALANYLGATFGVAIGHQAGSNSTGGGANVYIGTNAGQNSTTSTFNVLIGHTSGQAITSNGQIVSIGNQAGLNNNTGGNWTAIGCDAARYYSGGTTSATSFSNGIYLGHTTKVGAAGATNEVVIGYQAEGLGSNTTVIGNSSTTFGRWWGNLLIGSSVNGGQALQVTGLSSFTGTTASDGGQLGSELLSSANWTLGSGWTGDFTTGFAHSSGTATLTNTLAAVNGTYYQISYTVTNRTTGSFTIAFGGFTSGGLSGSGSVGPRATSTGTLVITPTTDFNGTIVISIKVITDSSATIQLRNSSGTITNEIRNNSLTTNTFIGLNAGSKNLGTTVTVESTRNTAVGSESLQNNTTGSFNSAFGNRSLQANTWGQYNNAFGVSALQNNLTGQYNNAFGYQALQTNTTGSTNSAFGWEALKTSNADNNSAFGRQALATTTGGRNSGFGSLALFNLTTGANNSAFGTQALFNLTTSSNVVALGDSAGFLTSTGANLLTAGNSTFIGQDSRPNADAETNQIVIGYQGRGLGSNTTVIGNSSTTFGRWWGNLLVGTSTNSGFALDVNGTARIQNDLTISDTRNIILATGTGTKIGTATSQKLGFWNATPIVQPTTGVASATRVGGGGTALTDTDTFDGYTLSQIVKALRNTGILA